MSKTSGFDFDGGSGRVSCFSSFCVRISSTGGLFAMCTISTCANATILVPFSFRRGERS